MITSIRLQAFKGHRDTTVPLGRFTALVGPNGSGKTSVLEALWLQSQLVERASANVLSGDLVMDDLRRRGANGPISLTSTWPAPNQEQGLVTLRFDQSLHPRAQMELVRLIKRLLDEIPDLQIVATTHSPYVLDELEPSQIHAFALREDGTVASKRLSDHPEAERMKGSLTSGQLWTLDEEREWVLAEPAS
jgi:predicted ATPase